MISFQEKEDMKKYAYNRVKYVLSSDTKEEMLNLKKKKTNFNSRMEICFEQGVMQFQKHERCEVDNQREYSGVFDFC